MADPFSIIAGAIGVVDVAVKVVKFIDETKKGADSVDRDLRDLATEIESLKHTGKIIYNAFEKDMKEGKTTQDSPTAGTWSAASRALTDCNAALTAMDLALVRVMGENGSSRLDRLKRHFRRLAQDEEFVNLRRRLDKGHHSLQTLLLTLNMLVCSFSLLRCSTNSHKHCHTTVERRPLCTTRGSGTAYPIVRRQHAPRCTYTSRGERAFHDSTVSQQSLRGSQA